MKHSPYRTQKNRKQSHIGNYKKNNSNTHTNNNESIYVSKKNHKTILYHENNASNI